MFCLTAAEACAHRAQFFEELKVLQRNQSFGADVESLVGFHHSVDCGLILTQVSGQPIDLHASLPQLFNEMGQVEHGSPEEAESSMQQRALGNCCGKDVIAQRCGFLWPNMNQIP